VWHRKCPRPSSTQSQAAAAQQGFLLSLAHALRLGLSFGPTEFGEHVSHAAFFPGRVDRSAPPQTPQRSSCSMAAWPHSHEHRAAAAPLDCVSSVALVLGCPQRNGLRGLSSVAGNRFAARDSSARLSSLVAVIRAHRRGRSTSTRTKTYSPLSSARSSGHSTLMVASRSRARTTCESVECVTG
jgi:hypothetical protein